MLALPVPAAWIAVALIALLSPPVAWAQQWTEFRPAGAGYRAEFPGPVTPYTDNAGSASKPILMYGGEVELENGTIYFSTVYNDEQPWPDPEARLDAGRDGSVRGNEGSVLREEHRVTIGGVPARRLVIDIHPAQQVLVQLLAVSGGRWYQASWTGPRGRENDASIARFLNSFAFVAR
jgi:hypothetical protein